MAKKRITSIDVAHKAGVSQSTVSRVLNGHGRFSAETHERVLTASSQLGYKPNALARSLITQQSNYVGIVMADFTSPFYPNVLDKFTLRLQELGRQILLFRALTSAPLALLGISHFELRDGSIVNEWMLIPTGRIQLVR